MISDTAVEELEQMKAEGLSPSVRDIIRLNAVGLRLEAMKKKHPMDATDYLPRVAAISKTVSFRQPTVGHDLWMDRIERIVNEKDYQTILAVKAYALSRPHDTLPDPDDPKSVTAAINAFCEEMKDFTTDQIYAAIDYVIYGADPKVGEYSSLSSVEGHKDEEKDEEDWKECVSIGSLIEGQVIMYGISRADLEKMTYRQLRDAIRMAYVAHGRDASPDVALGEARFYSTRDEIKARLLKEKENGSK